MASAPCDSGASRVEREANYTAVGAFVLLVLVMGGLFVYWYSDSRDHRDFTRFEIYFEGSVSGLQKGAPVRYLGVDVGRVVRLSIDPRSSSRVQVIVDIDSTTPVSERTVARLSLQGITGLLFIDLVEDAARARVVTPIEPLKYAVIPSTPSPFDVVLNSLPETLAKVGDALTRISEILSDDNARSVASIVRNIDTAAARLPATMEGVEQLIAELRDTAREIEAAAAGVRSVTDKAGPDITNAMARAQDVANNLAMATQRLDRLIADNEREIRSFARDGLPELERLLRESRDAAAQFRDLSRGLREQPSQLLYEPNYHGVEIPK
jgi:phospholipid/cholesterol/gamma-HCH transport system substrate-binding protein